MAEDWVKMRTDIYRDPKVCIISDMLLDSDGTLSRHVLNNLQCDISVTSNVTRHATVGALVSVWGIVRHRGIRCEDDLFVRGIRLSVIDEISDLPGFGDAMAHVGWAIEVEKGVIFPRFFETYNVDPTETIKEKNKERQRKKRDRDRSILSRDCHVTVTPNVTLEERREEKSINTPIPPNGEDEPKSKTNKSRTPKVLTEYSEDFQKFWSLYPKVRRLKKNDAFAIWKTLSPDELLRQKIFEDLKKKCDSHDWKKEGGKYVPHPTTYLNGRRWEDEATTSTPIESDLYRPAGGP